MNGLVEISRHRCFGGEVAFFRHDSKEIGGQMRFSIFRPEQALAGIQVPALLYLAGLTCTEEHLMAKGGATLFAAEAGYILVASDTSPRDKRHPGDDANWDFGIGAGFYLDATQEPWRDGYRMGSYVAKELPALIEANFPVDAQKWGIFGHSMGGHGALVAALRNPEKFRSVSAFAPVAAPSASPWGEKAFNNYLGPDKTSWAEWDATALVEQGKKAPPILIDVGTKDQFLERELHPHLFEAACAKSGQKLTLRRQEGYDHSYYFISTFMGDHIAHHKAILG
jgi:S-formylglutathione hydrolase